MAGRYSKGQKVRVPDAMVTEQGFKGYAGLVGEALGETGMFDTGYDRAVFYIRGSKSVGLFAGDWLEPVPAFSKGDTVRVLNNDNSPQHYMEVGTIGIVTEVNTTQAFGGVARVKGEGRNNRPDAHQWVHLDSLELVETPDLVDPNVGSLNGLTRGDRVMFTDTDHWHADHAYVGDRATFYGHRFTDDSASVLRMDDGRVFVAWSDRIQKWDGTKPPEPAAEAGPGEPNWSQVEAGDQATFRVDDTDETHTATAYHARGHVRVLGVQVDGPPVGFLTLLRIEKPKPALPTTPGSAIRDQGGLAMMLTDSGWIDQENDQRYPEKWTHDQWSLIHDAGAES